MFNAFKRTEMKIDDIITDRMDAIMNGIKAEAEIKAEVKPEPEEWIWVEGYKGTESDMKCKDYQYELNKRFDMPYDFNVKTCESGFHFCRDLEDVYEYYPIGDGHRYFKVRGLVRKADYEKYGTNEEYLSWFGPSTRKINKLAATSIEFISELTMDEIFAASDIDVSDYTEDEKKLCISKGTHAVVVARQMEELEKLGYSKELADYIKRKSCIEDALEIGRIPDISMDMKVWLIFRDE